MTTELRPLTLAEIRTAVREAKGRVLVAQHGLEVAGNVAERDMVTGYAGATALKHLREAWRELEKALTQLDTVVK